MTVNGSKPDENGSVTFKLPPKFWAYFIAVALLGGSGSNFITGAFGFNKAETTFVTKDEYKEDMEEMKETLKEIKASVTKIENTMEYWRGRSEKRREKND